MPVLPSSSVHLDTIVISGAGLQVRPGLSGGSPSGLTWRLRRPVIPGLAPYHIRHWLSLSRSVTQETVALRVLTLLTLGPDSKLAALVNLPVGYLLTTPVSAPQLLAESQALTL